MLVPMQFLIDGPESAKRTFLFAHGAGAPMDHPFMNDVARIIAEHGIRVVRFEFPYMAARRTTGKKRAPDREAVLLETWREAVRELGVKKLAIGGKSMGGRMATMIADELKVRAVVCFGYPFHPPGQPQKLRTAHLASMQTPTLILQGERDPFGTPGEVAAYQLSEAIRVEWFAGGDHSLKPKANVERAAAMAAEFVGRT
jgi:predicted alpha/beta-hydrolase family hydrolase